MFSTTGRLIPLQSFAGEDNMALDQALMESVDGSGVPVLRFYLWSAPTLSLGYFQKECDRSEHAKSGEIACVRRSTGGGAIVHHHELTYSISVPNRGAKAGPRLDLYRRTHQAIVETLKSSGVKSAPFRDLPPKEMRSGDESFLCFQRRTDEDLIVSGYKVVGSAQRKSRAAILQHGSLLMSASAAAPELPGIEDLSSRAIDLPEFAESFAKRLGDALTIDWHESQISEAEQSRSSEVVRERFGSPQWTSRR